MFFDFENVRAVRTDRWKLITRFPDGPNELYDLKGGPRRATNIVERMPMPPPVRNCKTPRRLFRRYADRSTT